MTALADPIVTARPSKTALIVGWILSLLPALLLIFSAVMKLARPAPVVDGFRQFGYPDRLIVPLGVVELACAILYLIPRAATLGAILLTGYLGGAVATNVRVENPAFIMPFLCGVVLWLGLFLRDRRLRVLLPLRKP
ncbi:MAG TPA: DoxX family protein [Tepidisphaeraceae bacterium]|jgi:uncharacterized membrane protein YphA (DoxX/SURF4 family)